MTEAEWLACVDTVRMLGHRGVSAGYAGWMRWYFPKPHVSRKKLWVFTAGCVA